MDHVVGVGVRQRLAHLLEHRHETAALGGRVGRARPAGRPGSRPLMSFMARKGRPSGRAPRSWTGGMPGCCNWPVIRASSAKRRAASESAAEMLLEHLDGHLAAERGVGGPVDHAHAAAGDLVAERVAPRAGRGDGGRGCVGTASRGRVQVGVGDRVRRGIGGRHPAPPRQCERGQPNLWSVLRGNASGRRLKAAAPIPSNARRAMDEYTACRPKALSFFAEPPIAVETRGRGRPAAPKDSPGRLCSPRAAPAGR